LKKEPVYPFTGKSFGSNEKDDEGRGTFQVTKLVMDKDNDWPWREKIN
jgi:hypothetical protein